MLRFRTIALTLAAAVLFTSFAHAQVAVVSAAQRMTEKSSGNDWITAGVGANLSSSDRFRTGKRSKADLKFRDGSLMRLGQLSYLEMRGAKQVNLVRGQLLFVALRPGRVLAGAAAAAIKGSVALIQYKDYKNSEGEQTKIAEFYLYSGLMDVISALKTISIDVSKDGPTKVTVYPDGTMDIGPAPPLEFFGGELNPDILRKPHNFVFVGSPGHEDWRDDPDRIERDHDFPSFFNPKGFDRLQEDTFPQDRPPAEIFEPPGFAQGFSATNLGDTSTLASTSSVSTLSSLGNLSSGGLNGGALNLAPFRFSKQLRLAAAPSEPRDAQSTLQAAEDASGANVETGPIDTDASAAYKHLEEAQAEHGRDFGGDAALVGAAASQGAYAYGARFHGFYARNNWFLDGAYFPMRVHARFDGDDKEGRDFSAISDLSLTYGDDWGQVQAGRQRFLSGPVQASLYGSMIRAGGREIMDAIRVSPRIADKLDLEIAYVVDAYPQKLPYRISGNQNGWYGRAATYTSWGNFGLNVLKYSDAEVDDTTGATVDFAIPIIRDDIEFYGEIGRDPFRRHIRTVGLTIPWLYDRTGFDVFLEYARLSDADDASAPPHEYTIRAYKRLNKAMNMVAALSRFSGDETRFVVGMSVGARTSR